MLSRLNLTLTAFTLAFYASPAASQVPAPQPTTVPQPAPAPQRVRPPRPISEDDTDGARHPVWIVVKPDGLHFVQSSEELKGIQQNPTNAFLIACREFEMKAASSDGEPGFVLDCRQAAVYGKYGTWKFVEMEGQNLHYETRERILQLSGSDDKSVRFSVEDGGEMTASAAQIQLQLGDTDYRMRATGVQMEFHAKPVRPVQPAGHSDAPVFRPYYNALPPDAVPVPPPYRDPSPPLPTY